MSCRGYGVALDIEVTCENCDYTNHEVPGVYDRETGATDMCSDNERCANCNAFLIDGSKGIPEEEWADNEEEL